VITLAENWVASGNAMAVIIGIVIIEILVLGLWLKGRAGPLVLGLIPGLCLMLALRAALSDHGAPWVILWITASLPFHLIDLYGRIKRAGRL
jgi:hypothetical protein